MLASRYRAYLAYMLLGLALLLVLMPLNLVLSRSVDAQSTTPEPSPTIVSQTPTAAHPPQPSSQDTTVMVTDIGDISVTYDLQPDEEVALQATDTLTDSVQATIDQLNQIPLDEQARLAEQALLPSTLLERESRSGEADSAAEPQIIVIIYRLFVPMVHRALPPAPPPTVTPTRTPTPTPRPDDDDDNGGDPADIWLRLWAKPSVYTTRGGTVVFELCARNYGEGKASSTRIRLPYDYNKLRVTNASFSNKNDWVSAVKREYVEITLGGLDRGKSRTSKLYFRVNSDLPNNTVLDMRAWARWDDDNDGGERPSNWMPVLVGNGPVDSKYAWFRVEPDSARAGTTFRFYTDRFIPGEKVTFWLNTPDGVKGLDRDRNADNLGRVWLDLKSNGFRTGYYSLVAHGKRSGIRAVRSFEVR